MVAATTKRSKTYEGIKRRAIERNRAASKSARDIGSIPPVKNPKRKAACARDFMKFCNTYFPVMFRLKWSDVHIKAAKQIETCALRGGLFAYAMPRGFGKTTLAESGAMFAQLYGHHACTILVGSTGKKAIERLDNIKKQYQTSDVLLEDFPEVVYPIRCIENESRRCKGQHHHGQPTWIEWGSDQITLPTIPGSKASGAIVTVSGLTGEGVRGTSITRITDGEKIRPTFAILDDPQTDESAGSKKQNDDREKLVKQAVVGLAGPDEEMAVVMPCTVIEEGDLADRMLDRDINPHWFGQRTKMLITFPDDMDKWHAYDEIRREEQQGGDRKLTKSTAYYKRHRKIMDKGCVITWEQKFKKKAGEISAIQHAMNIYLRDESYFWAECQNDPMPAEGEIDRQLKADQVTAKLNGLNRGVLPLKAQHLTAYIDIGDVFWWTVGAFGEGFMGATVDYGSFPDQRRTYFTKSSAKKKIKDLVDGQGLEAAVYNALEITTTELLGRVWKREDGAEMRIERLLIDAQWGNTTDVIYEFCRRSPHSGILMPAHGRGIKAENKPMKEWPKKPGDKVGLNWRIPSIRKKRTIRHIMYDTNWWKSFHAQRWQCAMAAPGSMTVFGRKENQHRLLVDHLTAEKPTPTEGQGREVDVWEKMPNRDNDFLDCSVGCMVAASTLGVTMDATGSAGDTNLNRKKVDMKRWAKRGVA